MDDSEVVKVMKESVKSQFVERKRESVKELLGSNCFVTEVSFSGIMIIEQSVNEEGRDSGLCVPAYGIMW